MTRQLAPTLTVLLLLVATGCDGGTSLDATTTAPPSQTSTTSASGKASLERAVKSALKDNRRLSIFVLWNNTIPSWGKRSTRGPALASLRTAAHDRRKRGVRVRVLDSERDILTVRLDPSYLHATANVRDRQRVQPSRRSGRPIGRPVSLNERARYELRRSGDSGRFVVWRVVLLR